MHPVLTEMTERLRTRVGELHAELARFYGARLVTLVLYGSHARADADAASDIDVLVVLEGQVAPGREIRRTSAITAWLSLEYDTVISCFFLSTDRYQTEQSPLLMNVRREGIAV